MPMKDSLKKAQKKYREERAKLFTFRFNRETDADIIAALEAKDNMQEYIRNLIRADIRRSKGVAEEPPAGVRAQKGP